jgi:hypothetical protein
MVAGLFDTDRKVWTTTYPTPLGELLSSEFIFK